MNLLAKSNNALLFLFGGLLGDAFHDSSLLFGRLLSGFFLRGAFGGLLGSCRSLLRARLFAEGFGPVTGVFGCGAGMKYSHLRNPRR